MTSLNRELTALVIGYAWIEQFIQQSCPISLTFTVTLGFMQNQMFASHIVLMDT